MLYFNNQNISSQHENKLQIKLSTLLDGRILPFELKEIDSRIKTVSPSKDSELEFKLLFPKSQEFSQQSLIQMFPSDIWQLVAEYLSTATQEEHDWYNQFITWIPTASPLNFTQKQKTKLQTFIAKIQEFQNELIELSESKHPLIRQNKLYRILFLAIKFLEGSGIAGLSLGLHFIKLKKSWQRHDLLASQDWQSCPSLGFNIYDSSVSTAPSLSKAFCDNVSDGENSLCNQLCDSFNSIENSSSSLRIGLIIGLVVILIILCMSCFYLSSVFEVDSLKIFNEIRTKIEIFCRAELNKSSLPETLNGLYSALEDERLRLSEQIPSLESPPRHHSIAIRSSQNGYILLPGGDAKDQERKKSVKSSSYSNESFGIN